MTKIKTAVAAKIDTKTFVDELKWVNRFVESKTTIPILANVKIVATDGFNGNYIQEFLKVIPPAVAFDFLFCSYAKHGDPAPQANTVAAMFQVPGWRYILMPTRIAIISAS